MAIKILPYKMASQSSKDLAEALGARRIRLEGSRYGRNRNDVIINWGNTSARSIDIHDNYRHARFLNSPSSVEVAHNKLTAYQQLDIVEGVTVPNFTSCIQEAQEWVEAGETVLSRTLLRANSGRGIVVSSSDFDGEIATPLVPAPLYVQYCKKADEFRVHVMNGAVFDIQQKRTRNGEDPTSYQIRSHDNGWVFCRGAMACPMPVLEMAIAAVEGLALDFGAVDIGWNAHHREATVYEVNTAPGLQGQTLVNYTTAFRALANG